MNADRTSKALLRLYPPLWRARYGDELHALIVETSGGRVPWRVRFDVVRAAARERLRSAGLAGDGPPAGQMRAGSLVVLCAWTLFVVPGVVVQKFSEHWQAATPTGKRGLPAGAFHTLVAAAAIGSGLVLVGIALALPSVARLLRDGGWRHVRRYVLVAGALTVGAVVVFVPVAAWAQRLSSMQRNGHDGAYAAAVGFSAVLLFASFIAWTVAAVAVARRLDLSRRVLRLETFLATAVTVCMAAVTAATVVWWAALASVAPWFLAGLPAGSTPSPAAPALIGATILMLLSTAVAAAGARQAVHAARR